MGETNLITYYITIDSNVYTRNDGQNTFSFDHHSSQYENIKIILILKERTVSQFFAIVWVYLEKWLTGQKVFPYI